MSNEKKTEGAIKRVNVALAAATALGLLGGAAGDLKELVGAVNNMARTLKALCREITHAALTVESAAGELRKLSNEGVYEKAERTQKLLEEILSSLQAPDVRWLVQEARDLSGRVQDPVLAARLQAFARAYARHPHM